MATTFNGRRKVRKSFGSIREVTEMPNLIEVQKASYDQFLLVDAVVAVVALVDPPLVCRRGHLGVELPSNRACAMCVVDEALRSAPRRAAQGTSHELGAVTDAKHGGAVTKRHAYEE